MYIKYCALYCLFFFPLSSLALSVDDKLEAKKQFKSESLTFVKHTIDDVISDNPINTAIYIIKDKVKILGFVRPISTTTGCDSACLPLNYNSYYDEKGLFKKIVSREGLTKIGHAPFNSKDYSTLEFILTMNPVSFLSISHPKELTDALSGETLKKYQVDVVKGAAYSTLRINLYNQDTLKQIKTITK